MLKHLCLPLTVYSLLFVVLVNSLDVFSQEIDSPTLSPLDQGAIETIFEQTTIEAVGHAINMLEAAKSEAGDFNSYGLIQTTIDQLRLVEAAPLQSGGGSSQYIVWCWIDNQPSNQKLYNNCPVPFLLGEKAPFALPFTASTSIQKAIDQAGELALRQGHPVIVLALPSFLPEILRDLTGGICGGDNVDAYPEQLQMKPGAIIIGAPINGEQVKVVCPKQGPAFIAANLYGESVTLDQAMSDLGLELEQVVEDAVTSMIEALANRLGQRLLDLTTKAAEEGLIDVMDKLFELQTVIGLNTGASFSDFIVNTYEVMDKIVAELAFVAGGIGAELGVFFAPIAYPFGIEYEGQQFASYYSSQESFEELVLTIRNEVRKEFTKFVSGKKDTLNLDEETYDSITKLISKTLVKEFADDLKDFLKGTSKDLNKKISAELGAAPVPSNATSTKKIKNILGEDLLLPVHNQFVEELTGTVEKKLTFLGDDIAKLLSEQGEKLADIAYDKVVVKNAVKLYKKANKKANKWSQSASDAIFNTPGLNLEQETKQAGKKFGEEMGNGVADSLESLFRSAQPLNNVFADLATEVKFSTSNVNTFLDELLSTATERVLTNAASKVMNSGLVFGLDIRHNENVAGPGVVVDGALMIFLYNTIRGHHAMAADPDSGLPDGGLSGGGVVVQGVMPSLFLWNEIDQNTAALDGAGVYFNDTTASFWFYNQIDHNVSQQKGGGVYLDDDSFVFFKRNDVDHNASSIGGGAFIAADSSIWESNSIFKNEATINGGGLAVSGNLSIEDNRITSNRATQRGGGAAFLSGSRAEFEGNRLSANVAEQDGGGVAVLDAGTTPTIGDANRIHDNFSGTFGGGVFVDSLANPSIQNNRIAGNFSPSAGGGVYWSAGSPIAARTGLYHLTQNTETLRDAIKGNTIINNYTNGDGGGMAIQFGQATLSDNQFSRNRADNRGGGLFCSQLSNVSLSSNQFLSNYADKGGGGIYCDSSSVMNFTLNYIKLNQTNESGGGVAITGSSDVFHFSDLIENNRAGTVGGGIHYSDSQSITGDKLLLLGNRSDGEGGGIAADSIDNFSLERSSFIKNSADPDGAPSIGLGRGGGVRFDQLGSITISNSDFAENTSSGDGGGIACTSAQSVVIQNTRFESNLADQTLGNGPVADPKGGGAYFADSTNVTLGAPPESGNIFVQNAADFGGGVAFERCPQVLIQSSHFESNTTDTDLDGLGDGGAGIALGANTYVQLGGDANQGEGNNFLHNSAGTPRPIAPRLANGGAFAIEGSARADVLGNSFVGNTCSFTGGALYFNKTSPASLVGKPEQLNEESFQNIANQNCKQLKEQITSYLLPDFPSPPDQTTICPPVRDVCIDQPGVYEFSLLPGVSADSASFGSLKPGRVLITAAVIPQVDEGIENTVITLRMPNDQIVSSESGSVLLETEWDGEQSNFSIEAAIKGIEQTNDGSDSQPTFPDPGIPDGIPSFSWRYVEGNPCELNSEFKIALRANNIPDEQALEFLLAVVQVDPSRFELISVESAIDPNSPVLKFPSTLQENAYDILAPTEIPLSGTGDYLILTMKALQKTIDASIPAFPMEIIDAFDVNNNFIEHVVLTETPIAICPPDEVVVPPENICTPMELWVTVRQLDGNALPAQEDQFAGLDALNFEKSKLIFAHILASDGSICPAIPVLSFLSGGRDVRSFQFSAKNGDVVDATISVSTPDGVSTEPVIQLFDSDGKLVALTNQSSDRTQWASTGEILPVDGNYILNISSPGLGAERGVLSVEVVLNNQTVFKSDDCQLPSSPQVEVDGSTVKQLDAVVAIEWPTLVRTPDSNALNATIVGNATQALPPWPVNFAWAPENTEPETDLTIGFENPPDSELPVKISPLGEPFELKTFRGGFIGIVDAPSVIVQNNQVSDNYAEAYGGGAFISQTNETVQIGTPQGSNQWNRNQSLFGGGIAVESANPVIQNNQIGSWEAPNIARFGGGMYLENSKSVMGGFGPFEPNYVVGNVAGVYVTQSGESPFIPNELVQHNSSYVSSGGGMYINGGSPQIVNSLIQQNSTSLEIAGDSSLSGDIRAGGGGIAASGRSSFTIDGSTMSENFVTSDGINLGLDATVHLSGGGVLIDDAIHSNSLGEPNNRLLSSWLDGNQVRYSIDDEEVEAQSVQVNVSGGGIAVANNAQLDVWSSQIKDSLLVRDVSNNQLASIPSGKALGAGVSITDNAQSTITESKIDSNIIAIFDPAVYSAGAGMSFVNSTVDVNSNWIIANRSSANGGGIHIQNSEGAISKNSIVESKAMLLGSGIFIQSDGNQLAVQDNIIESFGAEDSSTIFLDEVNAPENSINASFPIDFNHNNVIAAGGNIFSGSYSNLSGQDGNISEPLNFANPSINDFHISKNALSASASSDGADLGWNPIGLTEIESPKQIHVPSDHSTIQEAVDSALPGDWIWVDEGVYQESITLSDGVILLSASAAVETIIEPSMDDENGFAVDAMSADSRSVFRGFTIRDYPNGVLTHSSADIVLSNLVFDHENGVTAIELTDVINVENRKTPWISENTIRQYGLAVKIDPTPMFVNKRIVNFCELVAPIPVYKDHVALPWVHHNLFHGNQSAIVVDSMNGQIEEHSYYPIAFNNETQHTFAWLNLPELTGVQSNNSITPQFDPYPQLDLTSNFAKALDGQSRRIGAIELGDTDIVSIDYWELY